MTEKSKETGVMPTSQLIYNAVWVGMLIYGVLFAVYWAYNIRLGAIEEYGPIIHEFDPYFNLRATEYLYANGWKKFVTWFDYMVWYPLGRPVGTTIYPGMQVTAVFIKWILGDYMSLNDVCVYIPAWFGISASIFTGFLAYECSLSQSSEGHVFQYIADIFSLRKKGAVSKRLSPAVEVGVATMAVMAVIPAHLMRSVGGGYDNESVAMTTMTMTFYFWVRSLRGNDDKSHYYGVVAGLAYFYMVAAWGGYVFVCNMVGIHAAFLVLIGRFSEKVYKSYTLFYIVGTALAIQVPVVGLTPLKSLEQLSACAVFLGYQVLAIVGYYRKKHKLTKVKTFLLLVEVSLVTAAILGVIFFVLMPPGYFGPISSRVRGLFIKHTRTGNPLVDSVAEHQPASVQAYHTYLNNIYYIAPLGFLMVLYYFGDAASFLVCYACTAYFFSAKMVRLILLMAPVASCLAGVVLGRVGGWSIGHLLRWLLLDETATNAKKTKPESPPSKKKKSNKKDDKKSTMHDLNESLQSASNSNEGMVIKRILSLLLLCCIYFFSRNFTDYCWTIAKSLNQATIVTKGRLRDGSTVLVDDYRESYLWLKRNTPEDSRILAWWDYGYQIAGVGHRTTLADGNTWNHEHIALLGKILTTDVEEGYSIARHMADYALVWAGGGGDDIAKSPHLARIANSVYRDMCPNDPTCRSFGFIDNQGTPSPMMRRSFLYSLHSHGSKGVEADPKKFKEVYRSKYGKVRIFKILGVSRASKDWVANPKNRKCDVPGSWYCPGQYPPALNEILSRKKDFSQLEDFNKKDQDDEYTKKYFENMNDPDKAKQQAFKEMAKERKKQQKTSRKRLGDDDDLQAKIKEWKEQLTEEAIKEKYSKHQDTEETTEMWKFVNAGMVEEIVTWIENDPIVVHMRSGDGRGPMWWAYEAKQRDIIYLLKEMGVPKNDKDAYGFTPSKLVQK